MCKPTIKSNVIVLIAAILLSIPCDAKIGQVHRHFHSRPVHRTQHHVHHSNGSHAFFGTMAGAFAGTAIWNVITSRPVTVVKTPTVVVPAVPPAVTVQPTVVTVAPRLVWVEGHYEAKVDAFGKVIQVWIPGHYAEVK